MNRKFRKVFAAVLAAVMLLCVMPVFGVSAEDKETKPEIVTSGVCGKNAEWSLDKEGTLKVTGSGLMNNFNPNSPWYHRKDEIKKVVVSDGITSVGSLAFAGCSNLTDVSLPESIITVSSYAFQDCVKLKTVALPSELDTLGAFAFSGCSAITQITLPESLTTVPFSAFSNCEKLSNIKIGSKVSSIGDYAFYRCNSLSEISIPNSVKTIGSYAFYSCRSLTKLSLSENIKKIGEYSFYHCDSLMEVTINEAVTAVPETPARSIDKGAFSFCVALTELTLPASIKSLGMYAFFNCPSLKTVKVNNPELVLTNSGLGYTEIKLKGTVDDIRALAADFKEGKITFKKYEEKKDAMTVALNKTEKIDNFNLFGYNVENSQTAKYAYANEFTFIPLGAAGHVHSFVLNPSLTVPSTCAKAGAKIYECSDSNCNATYTQVLSKLEHTDTDKDGICDTCKKDIAEKEEPAEPGLLARLITKIKELLQKMMNLLKKFVG